MQNLEHNVLELKEAWSEFEKERKASDTNSSSLEKSDRVVILVKQMLEVVSKSNDALDGYSVYTAVLEKKLKIIPNKNDPKGKKESLNDIEKIHHKFWQLFDQINMKFT